MEKIHLEDIADLMYKCVDNGYTFVFNKSRLENSYNIHISHIDKKLGSEIVHLIYDINEELIRHFYENLSHESFDSIDKVMDFLYNEFGE